VAPFTDPERDQVARLHATGMGRNEISRQTGIHQRRVSAIAESLGLTFVRSPHVAAAAQAKVIDAKARRAALALRLLEDAERMRQQLFAPTVTFNIGGKDNVYTEHPIPQPTFRDQQSIMAAVGLAIDRAVKLDDRADESLNGLDSWLAVMAGSK
jgi:hypothetical protein